jgi:PAS domain S-box-containing protein
MAADHDPEKFIPGTSLGPADSGDLQRRAEEKLESLKARETGDQLPEETQRLLNELRVHQIELEMQNEELRRAREELEVSRNRYFDLYDLAPVGYCTLSDRGLILEANLKLAAYLGIHKQALETRNITRFIFKKDQDIYYLFRKHLPEAGKPRHCELRMVKKGGEPLWVALEAIVSRDEGDHPVCRMVISDISERKQIRDELAQYRLNLEALVEKRTIELETINSLLHDEIIDHKRTEAELEGKNEKILKLQEFYSLILENVKDGIWVTDEKDQLIYFNPAMEGIAGIKADQVLGINVTRDFLPETTGEFLKYYFKAKTSMEPQPYEVRVITPAGWPTVQKGWVIPRFVDGSYGGVICSIQDITEQVQNQKVLRESEERYRQLFEVENDALFLVDVKSGRILDANPAARKLYGYTHDALMAMKHRDISAEPEKTQASISKEEVYVSHRLHRKKDGTVFPVEISGSYYNYQGNRVHVAAIRDVTKRIAAEEQLRRSEERLSFAFKATQEGIWDWDLETDEVIYSPRWKTMLGYSDDEIEPHVSAWRRLLHPEDRAKAQEVVQAVLRGEKDYEMEFRLLHRDGHYVDILSRGYPIRREPGGPVLRIVGTHFDLTERKQAEEELRRHRDHLEEVVNQLEEEINQRKKIEEVLRHSEERLRLANEVACVGTYFYDFETGEGDWSPELRSMQGYGPDEPIILAGDLLRLNLHPEDRELFLKASARANSPGSDGTISLEFRTIRPDQTIRWLRVNGKTFFSGKGSAQFPARAYGAVFDITESHFNEECLRIEKEAALGMGVATGLEKSLEILLAACLGTGEMEAGGVYLVEPETGGLRLACHRGVPSSLAAEGEYYGPDSQQKSLALQEAPLYRTGGADLDDPYFPLHQPDFLSIASVPLRAGRETLGLLFLASRVKVEIPPRLQFLFESLAYKAATVVHYLQTEEEKQVQAALLKETNAALRVLLRHKEQDKEEMGNAIIINVKELILPFLEKLKKSRLTKIQEHFVNLLESNLKDIISPFTRQVLTTALLTPTEIRIADQIRQGKHTKEIVESLNVSEASVLFHRKGIRKKLGLTKSKMNLQSFLQNQKIK